MRAALPLMLMVIVTAGPAAVDAATCQVPTPSHPDIQSAVSDVACTEVAVAAGTFAESPVIARSLTLLGAGSDQTFLQGRIEVTAGTVHLEGLHFAAGEDSLTAHGGAETTCFDVVALAGQTTPMLFADGFETGDLSAWSSSAG